MFFPVELSLFACTAVVLIGRLKRIHRQILRGVDVARDAEVNTNAVFGVSLTEWRFLGCVFDSADERDVPLAGCLLFQDNLINLVCWWHVAVCADGEPANFFQSESHEPVVTRVVIHVEATGRIVRHRPTFTAGLPLQPPNIGAFVPTLSQRLLIVVNLADGLLCGSLRGFSKRRLLVLFEFVMLVGVRWLVVVVCVVVVSDSVITNLSGNVDMFPRVARHVIGQVRTKTKRVFHQY